MKRIISPFLILLSVFTLSLFQFCSNDKSNELNNGDTLSDTITGQDLNDSTKYRFKKLISAMPIPFDMLKKFSGANLPFQGNLLNIPDNATSYNGTDIQALNLGIYGADLAYMISQDKLADAAPYLRSIRKLSDAIVIPSAFDAGILKRYDSNQDKKDSLQGLIRNSYKRIDSTLQGNDRLVLATLVLTGGWIESIFLTTQHIGEEKQTEKNKVLFDMLSIQQPYVENITTLLESFSNDSTCKNLHADFVVLKTLFPKGPNIPPAEFANQLLALRDKIAEIRNKFIRIQ